MKKLLAGPTTRLAGRAVAAAVIAAAVQWHTSGGAVAWQSLVVGGGLAFCEVFTPLNAVVGYFKNPAPPATKA